MKVLNRSEILNAKDLRNKSVSVPEWGGDVFLFEPSADEIISLAETAKDSGAVQDDGTPGGIKESIDFQYRLLSLTICDENGTRIFNENDIREIGKKSKRILDRLVIESMEICNLTKDSQEELTKKSETTQPDALSTV